MTSVDETMAGGVRPWHLWVVGILGILWNGFGTFLWGATTFSPETMLSEQPQVYQDYVANLPAWASVSWGVGVIGGVLGSLLLLARSKLAVLILTVSLAGAVGNLILFIMNRPPAGFDNPALPIFIVLFAMFLLGYAQVMSKRGALN